ncbi:MAG TPA: cytochrome P450 [Baekduia sp.]|nr:cytochrome P450 [Baekduia sp.]
MDDFTSDLLRCQHDDPESISDREIASVVFGLSFAGHETTTNLLSNTIRNLVSRPEVWQRLLADRSLIDNAIEEVLRFDSSVICWRRVTTKPVTLAGVDLPAGSRLLLLLGSANHDPEKFDDPSTFSLDRPDSSRHMALGKGIHFCLGAPLARLQAHIVVEFLLERRPEISLVPDQELRFPENISFRGPLELKVRAPLRQTERAAG